MTLPTAAAHLHAALFAYPSLVQRRMQSADHLPMPSRSRRSARSHPRTGEPLHRTTETPPTTRVFAGGAPAPRFGSPPTGQAFWPISPHFNSGKVIGPVEQDVGYVPALQEKRRSWTSSLVGPMVTPISERAGESGKGKERHTSTKNDAAPYEVYRRTHSRRHDAEQKAAPAWSECAKVIKDHHDGILARWKEEIDTLLVYAGLFSAVLTAFTVETYVLLQPNSTDTTNALLAQMSAQLGSFSVDPTFINSTQPSAAVTAADSQSAFRATLTAVWINTLWFSSLICSLSAASIGMMVKQWLHENQLGLFGTSRDSARLRQYRYEALTKWHVGTIVALLPILLQLASALFLAGLLVLLWSLHNVVAGVASGLVGALLVFTIATVLAPAFAHDCAYRYPQALACVFIVQSIRRALWTIVQALAVVLRWRTRTRRRAAQFMGDVGDRVLHLRWAGIERPLVQKHQHDLDQQALLAANALVLDDSDEFTDKVLRRCVRTLPSRYGHLCLKGMCGDTGAIQPGLEHRNLSMSSGKAVSLALEVIESHLDSIEDNYKLSQEPVENLVADLRQRLEHPYIDVKVSVQLYQTIARLLDTCTKDSTYTADVFHILDNLSHRRWLHPAHYQSISCGKAAPAVTKALEGLLARAASVDAIFDMHYRLAKFLAVCYLRPGFCHNSDVNFAQKRLLARLHAFSDFFGHLAQGRYNSWLTDLKFPYFLTTVTDSKFIAFVEELHRHLPEAEGMIRYLVMYLGSDEVLARIQPHRRLDEKVQNVVAQLVQNIKSPPTQTLALQAPPDVVRAVPVSEAEA